MTLLDGQWMNVSAEKLEIRVRNAKGQLLHRKTLRPGNGLSLETLISSSGVYHIEIHSSNQIEKRTWVRP